MKKIISFILIIFLLTGCTTHKNPLVTMEIADYGTVEIELYPDIAPNTVANFVSLATAGFYDGLTFHRLVPGFILQGGDPLGNGTGGPGYQIKGEFSQNGFTNNLSHTTGIISMAREGNNYDSAGSQFFFVLDDNAKTSLDGMYAAFGKVTKGMDVLKQIEKKAEVANEETGALKENITIKKVTVNVYKQKYHVQKI